MYWYSLYKRVTCVQCWEEDTKRREGETFAQTVKRILKMEKYRKERGLA